MTCCDYPKPTIFALLATLTVLPFWQFAGAADSEGGRHSLIHRPQVHTNKLVPSPANPIASAAAGASSQPLARKIVRRPTTPSPAVVEALPPVSENPGQTDTSRTTSESIPDDDAPEPELEAAPQE